MIARTRRTRGQQAGRALLVVAAALSLAACDGGGTDAPNGQPSSAAPRATASADALSGTVTVLAAASLTDAFAEVAEAFEAQHPDVTVTLSFGGSSGLAQQILSGAPADVFAAASAPTMGQVREAGAAAGEPRVFARNLLQIAVPAGNPGAVDGVEDLADASLRIALCAEQVPCGAASARALSAAGVVPAPDTLERDVRAVLTKVVLDEVDAGLVYRTDALAAGDAVEGIDFPEAAEAVNDYPIVVLAEAPNPDAAGAFVDFVLGPSGQQILAAAGFASP